MLGPLEVRRGKETLALGGAKQRALLAILLLHANHVVGRERLAELLWSDDPPPTADHVIEVYVSQLRRVLEPAGAPYKVLVRKPAGYVVQVAAGEVDAVQFANLVESARSVPPAEAAAQLTRALDIWRGPALADFAGEHFALSEIARLDELRLYAREQRIDAQLALGHHARMIGELQGLVEEHPLRERLCGQLMLALYRTGRQAEASDVYQRTRERLVDELGMEPGPELQGLLKRILQQETGLTSTATDGAAATSLPSGTMTFLLTDIEGSTRQWDRNPAAMRQAMAIHDLVLGRAVEAHGGIQVESGREGDSILAVFVRPSDAVACGIDIQRELTSQGWPEGSELHVRVAIHSGEAELRGGHYFGPAVYRCARLLATGHGDQLLLSQAAHDLVIDSLGDHVTLRDLGSHRLRDLERPERIFQVAAAGLRSEFPPLKSMDPRRHNLPVSPTGFVGREKELTEIRERLAGSRLLTLIGAGGTGKTRLALQAAADISEGFADGVWVVELASLREPDLVPQAVAEALGVREEPGRSIVKSLVERHEDKTFLLVLDNCEHQIPPVVRLADRLLRGCPNIKLLATSRESLRVNGEAIMRIGPLAESDAVALFAERSAAAEPNFRLTPENAPSVREICRRVEGIPLAIELAAGRSGMMKPAEILGRLQESFGMLSGGSRSDDARHETLKAAMDWSYWLLTDEEQRLLRCVSVFTGGFTLEAAEAVLGAGMIPPVELLGQLVDKSLVSPQQTADDSTRYTVLETVREYGQTRLVEQGELDAAQRRHAEYFANLVNELRPHVSGPARTRWLQRLGADLDNLRTVFDAAALQPQAALALAEGMSDFWEARGEYTEGRARLDATLAKSPEPSPIRCDALQAAGLMAWAQGDQAAATAYTNEGLSLSRRLGDTEKEALCLQQLGQIATQTEDYAAALRYVNEALEIATRHGYDQIQELCEWRLGFVALYTQELDSATAHYQTSLTISARLGDAAGVAMSHLMLGNIALRQNRIEEARSHLRESLVIQRQSGSSRSVAILLESLAAVAVQEGRAARALRLGGAAEGLKERIGVVSSAPLHRELSGHLESLRRGAKAEKEWRTGAAMTREEAIGYALEEVAAAAGPAPS